ncbi:LOW QUALITY PROTEIN: arf-GAP domain and FG repeat-containing protein 1-like [Portunus trituberculatus]|uniref:LOW QUALITY PROTEIN: arf-GAP domain and FG repeat-containing protein 1-like n=1 Tax=Portunus trituberculatus TaxID=210409 RepID=UPI001E1CCCFD|nr:LOW QUALITY PROTEIN: arf-GAP domain and FG repeat-containing protein 1-like [Portunus trituberculatus]
MATSRRKQEERNLRVLREQGALEANRTCFDCRQRGTTYINMTIGSFVCTSCSGLLRGLNPPHRVKSISMASFTQEEIDLIKSRGNQYCSAVWLGLYDPKLTPFPDTKDEHKIRDFMITKYEKKRFYIDPSVALKIMPPNQDTSASSSAASTPGSDTASRGAAGAATQTTTTTTSSVSRPSVPASQSLGSVSSSGSSLSSMTSPPPQNNNNNNNTTKLPGPRPSASLDLLSDLGQSTRSALPPGDPFASPTAKQPSSGPTAAPVSQASFANFENANIFVNNPSGPTANSSRPAPPGPHLPFSSNPLTPLTPNTSTTSTTPNTTASASPAPANPSLDRYAALKDLDEEFKIQKENDSTNGGVSWAVSNGGGPHHPPTSSTPSVPSNTPAASVFGGSMNGAVFGSPPTGVFGGGVNGGAPVMGTPPTAPSAWQNFSGPNPFSGVNSGGAWVNGGAQMTNPPTHTQQGFGTMVQPNPFGTLYGMWAPDPNFNQFGGGAAMNGAGAGPGAGGGWANFSHPQQPSKMPWTATNGTPNPFMAAAPQMPSSGSSYNPFL